VAIEQHFLAIKANGTLWAWGDNTTGQLGDGTYNSTGTPIQIGTATNWKMVATATNRSFAIKTDGTMWGFGENINGETGVGITGPDILTPTQIGTGTNWDKIFAFGSVAFATKTDGSLWVWGLGINMFAQPIAQLIIRTPTRIGTATTWKSLSIAESNNGAYTALGVQTDGSRWVWGNNTIALYGDSTLTSISSTALPKRLICTTYVGVEDIQPQEASNYMQVYPNPTSGKFTLTLSDLQVNAPANLQILAATGQIAVQQTIAATATDALIDLTAQPAGLYFVSLRTANGLLLTTKVLKL
jgi:alpha-tubulin suppressor-like RCC1 family protein